VEAVAEVAVRKEAVVLEVCLLLQLTFYRLAHKQ
jgi:hypothetical protein